MATSRKSRKLIIGILMITLVTFGGYFALAKLQNLWPFDKSNTQESAQTIETAKESSTQQTASGEQTVSEQENSTNIDSKQSNPQSDYPRQLSISSQGFDENGNYELRVMANVLTANSAQCELLLNGTPYQTVDVQALPSSATCKGFTIKKESLKQGKNNFQVKFTSGEYVDAIEGEFQND